MAQLYLKKGKKEECAMSGWDFTDVEVGYVEVTVFEVPGTGSFLPLPESLAKKKAVINVRNKDNECLKWAIRSALFPPEDGKDPQRVCKYETIEDGIDWEGIDFPTKLSELDRLEKQNPWLALNVFGWKNDRLEVYRISKKGKKARLISLMLLEDEDLEIQHYCWVKRESALFHDPSNRNKKYWWMMCLSYFTREHVLENHKKYCNGVNGAPTRIEMPKEGENFLKFTNFQRQMNVPFVIYADFEAILWKEQETEAKGENESWTRKMERQEACGYAYLVVRSDGEVTAAKSYRDKNAVESFLKELEKEEKKIREALAKPKAIKMEQKDWDEFKGAKNCHVCEKSLKKEEFLDSLPVWNKEGDGEKYWGQGHRSCFYQEQNRKKYWEKRKKEEGEKMTEEDREIAEKWGKKPEQFLKKMGENEKKRQKNCKYCEEPLLRKDFRDAVKDHCHVSGKFRGAAHRDCNNKLRICPKTCTIPVVFHNLQGYDGHHIMQGIAKMGREVSVVAKNMEKYITFTAGNLRFIDSFNFLPKSLEALVAATPKEEMKFTKRISKREDLVLKKGVYPYEYIDCWERFEETDLPAKEAFWSGLKEEHVTDEEYERAQESWREFGCKTLGDYHNHYVRIDAAQLADVFENFRKICLAQYGLDPAHYFTSPGLSWDALLKKTGVVLELLTDSEKYLFIERGIRGGMVKVSKRLAKANNPLVPGHDPSKPTKWLMYFDANNLYGWAMSKPLPKGGFKWKREMPTEEEIMRKKENAKKSMILEVDLGYSGELHKEHTGHPLAPEKRCVKKEWLSDYQKRLMEEDKDLKLSKGKKLLMTLFDKENMVLHLENLKFYLSQGMKLKKVHRVLEFEQERWMEPYIRMNTEFRKKAKNEFEKDFYKLMNNSVYGKTLENLRNRVDIRLVCKKGENDEKAKKKLKKLTASPLYSRQVHFSENLVGIGMRKSVLFLNKPVYTGMTILDNSKIRMYDFFYNTMKKEYGEKCEMVYADTDSNILEIETEDIYKDMERLKDHFDTSDYPKEHPLHSNKNKKVLGKMKDECAGTALAKVVCLRPKMYKMFLANEVSVKKAKGVKKSALKRVGCEQYEEVLFGGKKLRHGAKSIRSEKHEIWSIYQNKVSLSPFDENEWIDEDGIRTKGFGDEEIGEMEPNPDPLMEFTDEEIGEMEAELSQLLGG